MGSPPIQAASLLRKLSSVCRGCLIPAHSRCLSPPIPAKRTGVLYHLSCNWGCLSPVLPGFRANHVAAAEFRILTFPCPELVGGPPAQVAVLIASTFSSKGVSIHLHHGLNLCAERRRRPGGAAPPSHLEALSSVPLRSQPHLYSTCPAAFSWGP